jgi:hypothetical protein
MSKNESHDTNRNANGNGDDPMIQFRKRMDKARSDFAAAQERSRRALAEADAALKIGSR